MWSKNNCKECSRPCLNTIWISCACVVYQKKSLTIKWTSIIHNWCNFYILRLNDIFISLIWVCCAFDKNIHHVNTHQMKKLPAPHLQMEPHPYIDYILNEFILKLIIYALKVLRKLEISYNVFHIGILILERLSELEAEKMSIEISTICQQIFKMFVVTKINLVFSRI